MLFKFLLVAILAAVVVVVLAVRRATPTVVVASPLGLEGSVSKLMRSDNPSSFFVVKVSNTEDFLQFSHMSGGVEMDYPQVTPRPFEMRAKFHAVCDALRLQIRTTYGSDGSEFLDVEIEGPELVVVSRIREVLSEMFCVYADDSVEVELSNDLS